jgi:hypothetical protein
MVRVAVTKVIDAKAQVPVPTDEVTTIAEAVNTFIKWPKRLFELSLIRYLLSLCLSLFTLDTV